MTILTRARVLALVALIVAACGAGPGATSKPGDSIGPGAATASAGGSGGGGPVGGPVATGGDLCGLLGPGDFTAAGIAGAGAPSENNSPPTDYYCGYAGKSSATGGIELDVFALTNANDADGVLDTVLNETGILIRTDRGTDVGADRAFIATDISGSAGKVAVIAVRKGKLVFDIGFPSGPNAERQLIDLAKLVISRAAAQIG